ncbi:MAG: hypothetical protein COA79_20775 [Planctomycetota bacterium]|nr:MAG: hypothetical protein COA79_20775 [Planctomycetota bacterium]
MFRLSIIILCFIFHSSYFKTTFAKDGVLNVVICAGQSNMDGARNKKEALPKQLQAVQKHNLIFNGKKWVPLAPGAMGPKGFGPEISLAYYLSKKIKKPIGIIKYSSGGTNLDKQWSVSDRHSLFHKMINHVKAAKKKRKINIIGMVWMQGESDAQYEDMSKRYSDNLKKLITETRKELKVPKMIFLSGRINPEKKRFTYVDIVRKAQETIKVRRYSFIDCDTLKKGSDKLHYNEEGTVEMGKRFAYKLLKVKR